MAELRKLGRYELRRVLGKGAMGVVYEGFDPTLGRRVAVKTILRSAALDEETHRAYSERFVREAKAVGRLNHAHIVQVHDFGEQEDIAYLVMEYIEGRELRSYFDANERFDAAEVVRIMAELLDALDFAHEAGVIHRDVKPANVMLDAQRRVKLADFGVARVQDSDRSAAGTMVGTPAFMSPEQISGGKIDRRSDVFSAGVVLYQLLTGEQPFKGEGAWTVAKQIMQDEPPQPSAVVSNVSPVFDDIVQRALAKDPAERYLSAAQFAAALRAAGAGAPLPAAPAAPRPAARSGPQASLSEIEFWRSIQNSNDAAEFELYLSKFPQGTYAGLAQRKRDKLHGTAAPAGGMAADATLIPETLRTQPTQPAPKKAPLWMAAGIAVAVVGVAAGAYLLLVRAPQVGPQKVEVPAAEIEKIRTETEARIRREFADKSAAEQAAAAKAATEKAVQEKQALMEKAAADKAAAEKLAAEKAQKLAAEKAALEKSSAAEKAAAAKAVAERAALEKAAAEKAAAEKVAAEKLAAEKAAAERAAAEKAALEKAAAEKAAAEKAAAAKAAAATVAAAAPAAKPNSKTALEQFIARHGESKVLDTEPLPGGIRQFEIVYVNDGSCPEGEIREVRGGSQVRGMDRIKRCIKLAP